MQSLIMVTQILNVVLLLEGRAWRGREGRIPLLIFSLVSVSSPVGSHICPRTIEKDDSRPHTTTQANSHVASRNMVGRGEQNMGAIQTEEPWLYGR